MATQLTAHLTTNHGTISVTLFGDHAPKTVENFVGLAEGTKEFLDHETRQPATRPFYDGLVFHRIIAGFMLQGGDPQGDGRGGPGFEFEDEFHPDLQFDRPYLLAMANAGPNTNGSQFFICTVKTEWLDGNHTVFGSVVEGMDVVQKLEELGSRSGRTSKEVIVADCGQL